MMNIIVVLKLMTSSSSSSSSVTQQYVPVLQVLVKYVFSTYLYHIYSRSTSHSSSGNNRIVISVSLT